MQEAGSGPVRRGGYAVVKFFDLEMDFGAAYVDFGTSGTVSYGTK